jgi:hypothetical protein
MVRTRKVAMGTVQIPGKVRGSSPSVSCGILTVAYQPGKDEHNCTCTAGSCQTRPLLCVKPLMHSLAPGVKDEVLPGSCSVHTQTLLTDTLSLLQLRYSCSFLPRSLPIGRALHLGHSSPRSHHHHQFSHPNLHSNIPFSRDLP